MFEGAEVKHSDGTVCADGGEDFSRGGGPGYVVHFSVVCDELSHGCSSRNVPDCTCLQQNEGQRGKVVMVELKRTYCVY